MKCLNKAEKNQPNMLIKKAKSSKRIITKTKGRGTHFMPFPYLKIW